MGASEFQRKKGLKDSEETVEVHRFVTAKPVQKRGILELGTSAAPCTHFL